MAQTGTPISGQITAPGGGVAAYAQIYVCAYPATGTPCFPQSAIYSDIALTHPLPQPYVTDQFGNYTFFVNLGTYLVQSKVSASQTYSRVVATSAGASGGTITNQANGVIPLATGTNAIGAQSHLSDNGSTVASTEPVSAPTLTDGTASLSSGSLSGAVNATFSGTVAAGNVSALSVNGEIYANQESGADPGAQINAALSSLSGAPGKITVVPTSTTWSTAVNVTADQQVLYLRPGSYIVSAPITISGKNSGIECDSSAAAPNGGNTATSTASHGTCRIIAAAGSNLANIVHLEGTNDFLHNVVVDGQQFTGIEGLSGGNNGSGYTSTPTCTITGDGTGATCVIGYNTLTGACLLPILTGYGTGYTTASVAITGGGGSGCTVTASLGPNLNPTAGPNIQIDGLRSRISYTSSVQSASHAFSIGNGTNINNAAASKFDHVMTVFSTGDGIHCNQVADVFVEDASELENSLGYGVSLNNCPTWRIEGDDIGGNQAGGIVAQGTYNPNPNVYSLLSSGDFIIGNQFGNNGGQAEIDIEGYDATNGGYTATANTILGNQFIGGWLRASGASVSLTSVAASSGGTAVYSGSVSGITCGGSTPIGITVVGFTNPAHNGNFYCTGSTSTTLTLTNGSAVGETAAASATPFIAADAVRLHNSLGNSVAANDSHVGTAQVYNWGVNVVSGDVPGVQEGQDVVVGGVFNGIVARTPQTAINNLAGSTVLPGSNVEQYGTVPRHSRFAMDKQAAISFLDSSGNLNSGFQYDSSNILNIFGQSTAQKVNVSANPNVLSFQFDGLDSRNVSYLTLVAPFYQMGGISGTAFLCLGGVSNVYVSTSGSSCNAGGGLTANSLFSTGKVTATTGVIRAYAATSGSDFSASGCSLTAQSLTGDAGTITLGTNTCTLTVTSTATAAHGWVCNLDDETTAAQIRQTSQTTTTALFSVPASAGTTDTLILKGCLAY